MTVLNVLLFALSLCADCFAVALCSSVSLRAVSRTRILSIALVFAVIQSGFLALGWALGALFVGFIRRAAHLVGFLLLLYVGGSMLWEGLRREDASRDLTGLLNVILGGVATSIDALAAGVSLSLGGVGAPLLAWQAAAVFACTLSSVMLGIAGGVSIGRRAGFLAEIVGGIVLICIGIALLL